MFALESNMLWCDRDDICSCGSPLPRLCDAEVFVFEAVCEKGMCDRRSRRGLEFGLGWGVWLSSDEKNYLGGDEWADDRMSVEKLEMTAGARDGYLRSRWKRENGEMKMWRAWDETWKRFSISSSWLSFVRWNCDGAWWGAALITSLLYSINFHFLGFCSLRPLIEVWSEGQRSSVFFVMR